MALVSYQTITLSKGKHASPEDGVCVMELASMLAGESFTDRPRSVCPVIGSFLRAYNDRIDDGRRQDLYAYAAKVVGSRASQDVEHARAERLSAWALELRWSRWLLRLVPPRLRALVPASRADLVGSDAVCAIPRHSDRTHAEVLALIDELLMIGPDCFSLTVSADPAQAAGELPVRASRFGPDETPGDPRAGLLRVD